MKELEDFKKSKAHTEALKGFLNTPTGKKLSLVLRATRESMTTDNGVDDVRICGRHDVFMKLDDLFFVAQEFIEPKTPQSKKGGKNPKPHTSQLP